MRTLHLYVLRQVLATLAMTVAVFTGLFLIVNALKEILPLLVRHVPLANVLEVVAMLLPFGLVFALPMGLLTATLLVFGRLGADQELTAVRSGGVSLISLILPVVGLSVLASGVAAFLNLELAPWCRVRSKELLYELGVAQPTALLVEQRFVTEFPGWTIYLGKRTGEAEFEQVRLYELKQEQLTQRIHARRGRVTTDPATRQIVFRLFEAEVFTKSLVSTNGPAGGAVTNSAPAGAGEWSMVFFDEAPPVKLDLSGTQPSDGKPKLSEMSFRQLLAELRERQRQGIEVMPVLVHMNRQVSFSFACIGFTLIGIPLGIRGHRRETSFGIAAALGLTAVYYSFIIVGQSWELRPHLHPHLIVWVPNFLFQGMGGWLLWRANRGL